MINQIQQTSTNKPVFAPLQNSDIKYAVAKPITETQKKELTEEKEHKTNAFGYTIAVTATLAGLGVLLLSKGASKSTRNNFKKMIGGLSDKSAQMKQRSESTPIERFYFSFVQNAKILALKSKALFNLAPLKDVLVNHILKKNKTTKKIADKITEVFEKISVKTSRNAYNRTEKQFNKMYECFREANTKIPQDEAKKIEEQIKHIQLKYHEGFSEPVRMSRLESAKTDMAGIDDEVLKSTYGNIKEFISKYDVFVSEEKASVAKSNFNSKIHIHRRQITNGKMDNYIETKKLLAQVNEIIDPTDMGSRTIIKEMKNHLEQYKKVVETKDDAQRVVLSHKIAKNVEDLSRYIKSSEKYSPDIQKSIMERATNINVQLTANRKGELQEILSKYRELLPEKEYLKIKKEVYKASDSLDKSIDTEGDKLFDKVRDLLIGSAPMDVLGVLSSVGLVGWGLSKADDNKQRVSVALKYGIPAIGGVLTTLYCTLGLVAGGPSLIVGFFSGILMNKLGVIADNQIKKQRESQNPST